MLRHHLESLELRTLLDATLDNGLLNVTGTEADDAIVISTSGDQIVVDINGTTSPFDANQVNAINVQGLAGADTITLDVNRPSTIIGGTGNDSMTGGDGDDTFVWDPGDGSDLIEGRGGSDTLLFNGSGADEIFTVVPVEGQEQRVALIRSVGNIRMNTGTTEHFVINALGGNDTLSGGVGVANLIDLRFDGGEGDDSISGTDANETLIGGAGNDSIDGNRGADTALLGDGDDLFIWDPGDGSDVVEGGEGFDEMQFNGSAGDEIFEISPTDNNSRVRFTRNLGNIVMDTAGLERIDIEALAGADLVSIRDTTGTGLEIVDVELGAEPGKADESLDTVRVFGSDAGDTIVIAPDAGSGIEITGASAAARITSQGADDRLEVNGRGGSDRLDASALDTRIKLAMFGNTGHDTLLGGAGEDILVGDAGNDLIDGNRGNDAASMGAGNDTFVWDPGDGSDVVNGGVHFDTLLFNGSGGDEVMEASSDGDRLRFTRDLGNIVMDMASTEALDVRAQGGNDTVTIQDLTAAGTFRVRVDGGDGNDTLIGGPGRDTLIGGPGEDLLRGNGNIDVLNGNSADGDDGVGDRVLGGSHNDFAIFGNGDRFDMGPGTDQLIFTGTNSADTITVDAREANGHQRVGFITNLGNKSAIFANGEIITVEARSGNDTVVMSDSAAKLWRANFLGGSGNDLLIGGTLDDTLRGETGSDILIGLDGTDDLDGGTGRNVVVQ